MRLNRSEIDLFNKVSANILSNPEYLKLKNFRHHGKISIYDHCIAVALNALASSRSHPSVNKESLIKAALLHDFFLYDWHVIGQRKRLHGFRHPYIALENARKQFEVTPEEENIILHHMWPLCIIPPKKISGWIVIYCDKIVCLQEIFHYYGQIVEI